MISSGTAQWSWRGSKFKAYFRRGEIFLSFFCRHLETGRLRRWKDGKLASHTKWWWCRTFDIYTTKRWYCILLSDCCDTVARAEWKSKKCYDYDGDEYSCPITETQKCMIYFLQCFVTNTMMTPPTPFPPERHVKNQTFHLCPPPQIP